MSYTFSGFLVRGPQSILHAALEQWPECEGRVITDPFPGIGVSCPGGKVAEKVRRELRAWSTNFLSSGFVWIEVECFGGPCNYAGNVYHNGEVLLSEWPVDDDWAASEAALRELLLYLGVENKFNFFLPFDRGYFAKT